MLSLEDCYSLGFDEGYKSSFGGMGMTFDDDPNSPRSEAYDRGLCHGEAARINEHPAERHS
ncbi:hypothetical protein [Mycolicibacterium sp.]|uniref:hypothetical protein n=1 Tax=Mycolicibacterium sp. TaxID=2320850 RepID=UPI0037C7520C